MWYKIISKGAQYQMDRKSLRTADLGPKRRKKIYDTVDTRVAAKTILFTSVTHYLVIYFTSNDVNIDIHFQFMIYAFGISCFRIARRFRCKSSLVTSLSLSVTKSPSKRTFYQVHQPQWFTTYLTIIIVCYQSVSTLTYVLGIRGSAD